MFERLPLKDIHLPDPVSWWPPAIGWWLAPILLVLFVVLLRIAATAVFRSLHARRLRTRALGELALIEREFDASRDAAGTMQRISTLLRRVAITVYPQRAVAGCTGQAWADWLCRTGPDRQDTDVFEVLTRAPYQAAPDIQIQCVLQTVERWIRHATSRHSGTGQTS